MIDYNKRLDNLRQRRFDDELKKAILSEAFNKSTYGVTRNYVLESMMPIDAKYTENTYNASSMLQNQIRLRLKLYGYNIDFAHQGSVPTDTHIKVYSDLDLLAFDTVSYSLVPPLKPSVPYKGDPIEDLKQMRNLVFNILKIDFPSCNINNENSKALKISGGILQRKIDIIYSHWLHDQNYYTYNHEHLKGICFLDRDNHQRIQDYPFLHIKSVNDRDIIVNGNEKRLIRLLKNLKVDSDKKINLSSFDITSIVHTMTDVQLNTPVTRIYVLLTECNNHLEQILNNNSFRDTLYSPNGKEKLKFDLLEVKKLKDELDETIADIEREIKPIYESFQKAEVNYL